MADPSINLPHHVAEVKRRIIKHTCVHTGHCHYASLSPISHRGEVGDTAGEAREMMLVGIVKLTLTHDIEPTGDERQRLQRERRYLPFHGLEGQRSWTHGGARFGDGGKASRNGDGHKHGGHIPAQARLAQVDLPSSTVQLSCDTYSVQLERPDAGCRGRGSRPLPKSPMACRHAPSFLHTIPPLVHASPGDPAGGRGSDDKRKWLLAAVSREYFVAVEYPWEAPFRDPMLLVFPGFSDEGLGCLGGMDPERGRASERRGLYVWTQHTRWDFAGEGNQDQEERYKSNEAPAETSVSSLLSREVFLVPLQLRSQPSVDVEYGRRTHRDPSS
ncbi:hypothetical protein CCUS01_11722 [Colletotrichum cuscutae]|uniref:Uncharacterized protein n=1 Tax=Colletotrichum cuscutae TaxID=1209917 RepID=A0AAI9U0Y8_9PEZI|nr:hypothetical protein CCUS01_11722 [Colletotrichum cuscutae]